MNTLDLLTMKVKLLDALLTIIRAQRALCDQMLREEDMSESFDREMRRVNETIKDGVEQVERVIKDIDRYTA